MKIKKYNESEQDYLFVKSVIKDFEIDILKEFNSKVFCDILDDYDVSVVISSASKSKNIKYNITYSVDIDKDKDPCDKYNKICDFIKDCNVAFERIINSNSYKGEYLLEDYPMPTFGKKIDNSISSNTIVTKFSIILNF